MPIPRLWNRRWLLLWLCLLPLLAPPPAAGGTPLAQVGNPSLDATLYEAVLPDYRAEIIHQTAGELPIYAIRAELQPAAGQTPPTIAGSQDLTFINFTDETLDALYFRLYANSEEYAEGGMAIDTLTVDGQTVVPELSVGGTVAHVPLAEALAVGEAVEVALDFTATVPVSPPQSYGMYAFTPEVGTWALAHWHPVLAGYDPTLGWYLEPPSELGDPIFTNTALYDVALTVPSGSVVVTTGTQVDESVAGEQTTHRFVSGPSRDFTTVVDDNFAVISEEVNGTVVNSYFHPDHEAIGRDIARYGAQALAVFNDLFGPYPYREMDLVEVPVQNALGVEFPQLMYMDDGYYDGSRDPVSLEFTTVHEVAHQWWYAMVGNNQNEHAYIDEGLTNYVSAQVYFERLYGAAIANDVATRFLLLPYLNSLLDGEDYISSTATDDFATSGDYIRAVYYKAALGFGALRAEIGDDAFFAGLRDYADQLRFDVAEPDDLRAAFERAAGRDLSEFWRHWFDAAEGREDFGPEDLP